VNDLAFKPSRLQASVYWREAALMETWTQDIKYGLRTLLKKPAFTSVAVLSLALGIGANTAIFTVINAVFNHPLAIADPSSVVELFTKDTKTVQAANANLTATSLQNFEDYRTANTGLSAMAAFFPFGLPLTQHGETNGVPVTMTSANYFDLLGVKPAMGRFFSPEEDLDHAMPVAILSHAMWVTTFGADAGILGKSIVLNNIPFSVIGVGPDGFKGTATLAGADVIWVPLGMRDQLIAGQLRTLSTNRRFRWISMLGRLKPGVTMDQARTGLKVVATSLAEAYPDANLGRTIEVSSVSDSALGINDRSQFVKTGTVLMAVVGLVLLIACVNLANLLLAQSARREREIAVRSALGANRRRLVRQMLVESVLLSLIGGGLGLVIAYWGRNALWSFRPPFLGQASIDLSLDSGVLGFTALVSVLTGLIFGIVPAVKLSRTNLTETLKIGGRSGSSGLGQTWLRSVLVAGEIALATVALVGSGLFVRSMQAAQNLDLGFDAKHVAFIGLNPGSQHYDTGHGLQFYEDAMAKARQAQGVEAASVASIVPLSFFGGGVLLTTFPEGQTQNSTYRGSLITYNDVTPAYFETLRIPMRGGRDFTQFDREGTTPVAIVNETTAKQLWPGQNAVGKRFTIVQQTELYEVVGVVATSTLGTVGEDPAPQIYRPMRQDYQPGAALVIRTSGDPASRLGLVRDAVQTIDRTMPLRNTGTVHEQIDQDLWASRMGAALLSIFGGLALALAMIGVYGVMSYSVAQRTPEIGFRIALGAQPINVLWLVMRQGLTLAACGALAGIALAVLAGRSIATLLYGIQPADPLTLLTVTGGLTLVALLACYIPARRATRVDPLVALRAE
jgi:predicted permease